MRKLLFFAFAGLATAAVVLPLLYLIYAEDVPDLSTPAKVRSALARRVEGERMANRQMTSRPADADFEILPFESLPKGLVLGLLAMEACPEFLEFEKESGIPLVKRALLRTVDTSGGAAGPGRCQIRFADLLADAVGIVSPAQASIAIHRIASSLSQKELVAYRFASTWYDTGVIGIQSASKVLFGKPVSRLDLAESAELLVAESDFQDARSCKNPSRLKLYRDNVLSRIEAYGGITEAEANRARARPLACSRRP